MSCIREIIFSYELNRDDYKEIRSKLQSMDGCQDLAIRRSTLTDSRAWKKAVDGVVRAAREKQEPRQK
jgi:hypothetical protein